MQTSFGFSHESLHEGLPDGGGGSGTIRRGIKATFSAMRTLNRNRQLLWFTVLAGLVLAVNAISHAVFRYTNRTLQPDTIVLYAQDFFLGFATLFCLVFLLAGLIVSISLKKEGPASFLEGLYGAKKYLNAILIWSLVLALAGMLLDRMYVYVIHNWFPHEFMFLNNLFGSGFFYSTITQFPFNWTLDWSMLTEIPGYGGRSLLLWIYPFGVLETLEFSALTLLLFALTPFVVPLVVLEHKTLRESIAGSFALLKKTWAGVATCALFLGVIVIGVFLMHLLIQAVSGIVNPYNTIIFHPPGTWIALALLYNTALVIVAFVMATVGGIAVLDLYHPTKSGSEIRIR
ncbi:MAG: hypothetical protein ABFC78_02350 [Methanoregula sp.]